MLIIVTVMYRKKQYKIYTPQLAFSTYTFDLATVKLIHITSP